MSIQALKYITLATFALTANIAIAGGQQQQEPVELTPAELTPAELTPAELKKEQPQQQSPQQQQDQKQLDTTALEGKFEAKAETELKAHALKTDGIKEKLNNKIEQTKEATAKVEHGLTEAQAESGNEQSSQDKALELLSYIDSLRGYQGEGFEFTLANISFKKNKQHSRNQLLVKVLDDSALVDFMAPARSKGRKILKQGQNMWLRFPRARNVLRVSAAQRLLGEASNGDITGTNFSIDYQPTDLSTSEIIVNEQTLAVNQLSLESKHDKATYQKVVFFLNSETNLPIRGDFYARSGKLAKQAFYTKFKEFNGELKVHRMRLDNPLVEGSYTWMSFDDFEKVELSEAIFHKDALSR